ncbi:MAG: TolB family protein, partial [Acidimicrobiia bacterium]
ARSVVEGQRAGDEPYSMVRIGDSLVVGWSEIFAVDIVTREATSLGLATIFVPGAEPDRVWMIDWPGGAIGSGTPEVWQVSLAGEQLAEPVELDADGFPAFGIPGGLVLESARGLELWDATTGGTDLLSDGGRGSVLDVTGDEIAWCNTHLCTELHVTNLATSATESYPLPEGRRFRVGPGAFQAPSTFSPDGELLAAIVESGDQDETGVWILDRRTGEATVVSGVGGMVAGRSTPDFGGVAYLAWAPDGSQLFATSWSYGQTRTIVWRIDVAAGELQAVILPFGGGLAPVVIDAAIAGVYFGDEVTEVEGACRGPSVQPSGRTGICTFGY